MLNESQLSQYFKLNLPIKNWDGRPGNYSNLKEYRLNFTQKFGMNALDYSQFGLKGHNGIDIAGVKGTPISAPCRMWISFTNENDTGYGINILAETETIKINGEYYKLELVFGHFESIVVKAGHWVNEGDLIGYMDSTGFSTGNHLHFGIRPIWSIDGNTWKQMFYGNGYAGYIDPEPFLPHIVWDLEEILKPQENNIKNMLQKFKRDKQTGALYFVKVVGEEEAKKAQKPELSNTLCKQKFEDTLAPVIGALGDEFGIESWNTDKFANLPDYKFFGK